MKFNPSLWSAVSENLTVPNASGSKPNSQVAKWRSWLGRPMAALAVIIGMAASSSSLQAGQFPYQVSLQNTSGRPAGGNGGGGDFTDFVIIGVAPAASRPAGDDGGICRFGSKQIVIVGVSADTRDFLATHEVCILGQSGMPGVFEAVFYDGREMFMGLVWLEESKTGINLGIWY